MTPEPPAPEAEKGTIEHYSFELYEPEMVQTPAPEVEEGKLEYYFFEAHEPVEAPAPEIEKGELETYFFELYEPPEVPPAPEIEKGELEYYIFEPYEPQISQPPAPEVEKGELEYYFFELYEPETVLVPPAPEVEQTGIVYHYVFELHEPIPVEAPAPEIETGELEYYFFELYEPQMPEVPPAPETEKGELKHYIFDVHEPEISEPPAPEPEIEEGKIEYYFFELYEPETIEKGKIEHYIFEPHIVETPAPEPEIEEGKIEYYLFELYEPETIEKGKLQHYFFDPYELAIIEVPAPEPEIMKDWIEPPPFPPPPPTWMPVPAPEEEPEYVDLYELVVIDVPVPEPDIEPEVVIAGPAPEPEEEIEFAPIPPPFVIPSWPLNAPTSEFPDRFSPEEEFSLVIDLDIDFDDDFQSELDPVMSGEASRGNQNEIKPGGSKERLAEFGGESRGGEIQGGSGSRQERGAEAREDLVKVSERMPEQTRKESSRVAKDVGASQDLERFLLGKPDFSTPSFDVYITAIGEEVDSRRKLLGSDDGEHLAHSFNRWWEASSQKSQKDRATSGDALQFFDIPISTAGEVEMEPSGRTLLQDDGGDEDFGSSLVSSFFSPSVGATTAAEKAPEPEKKKEESDAPGELDLNNIDLPVENEGFPGCTTIEQIMESDLVTSAGGFSIVGQLVSKSGFLEGLKFPSMKSTWFVPSDTAFENLPEGLSLDQLLNDTSIRNNNFIRKMMLYNMVSGSYLSEDFEDGLVLKSLYSTPLLATPGAFTNKTRQEAVLTLKETNGNWTVVGGGHSASIVVDNIQFCQTVVHIIDEVLFPPDDGTFLPSSANSEPCNSITGRLGSLIGTLHFSILRRLLQKGGFDKELGNPNLQATIFAPVDDAFLNLPPPYSIDRMLNDNSPSTITQLQKLMLFHTVPKRMRGEDLIDGQYFPTYLGFYSQPPAAQANSSRLLIHQHGNETTVEGGSTMANVLIRDMGELAMHERNKQNLLCLMRGSFSAFFLLLFVGIRMGELWKRDYTHILA
ncbi:hypothetical protein BSKO_04891 [Bryopsis sp. KO-2023]|nr:hypothetical protein BSKO_04891 [Bryopsis sp. KO-2023]